MYRDLKMVLKINIETQLGGKNLTNHHAVDGIKFPKKRSKQHVPP
jgi:hypothetical protein